MDKCVVTDRVLLLGLDSMFRYNMQSRETSMLLPCARLVARILGINKSDSPTEGYYADNEALAEYFGLIRALQETKIERRSEVERMPAFRHLLEVCSSRIFGFRVIDSGLLPTVRDSLSQALTDKIGNWEMNALIGASAAAARSNDDYSLVGIASMLMDGACLTAVRETAVLYAEVVLTSDELFPEHVYEWDVSEEVGTRANRLIDEYNRLFHADLPAAKADNAERFFEEYKGNSADGRCVRIGTDLESSPIRYYHWKIDRAKDGSLNADSFWSEEIWTTEKYRQSRRRIQIERARSS
jgi:hypothetical protein